MSCLTPAFKTPEGSGLVSITTSHTPENLHTCGAFPVGCFPSRPDAVLIDQEAMRLKRLKKNVITSARYHQREAKRSKPLMVTLTYRPGVDWNAKQIASYLTNVRNWLSRKGHICRYVWVFELTKAGRPHYHVLFWLPRGLTMPKADKRGWWPNGLTRTEWARNAVGYLAKYASKGTDDVIPKGVRLYGVGGLSLTSRLYRAWWNLPTCVRHWGFPADRWRRAAGGGWVCRSGQRSGEWRESLWAVQIVAGRVFAFPRLHTTASPFDQLLESLKLDWSRIGL